MKNLEEKGLINYEPYSFITLTEKGAKIAREIRLRHVIMQQFLEKVLQVDPEKAEATACRMEHVIDSDLMERLVQFIAFIDICPRTGPDWLEHFIQYCATGEHDPEECNRCIAECRTRHLKKND